MDSLNAELENTQDSGLSTQVPGATADEDFCANWLAIQSKIIPDVRGGLILLGPADSGLYRPAAVWPDSPGSGGHLMAAGEQALKERSPLIIQRRGRNYSDGPADSYEAAYPIQIEGQLYGAIVLEVSSRPKAELELMLQQLSWGSAWLEVRLYRQRAVKDAAGSERLQAVLDVLATMVNNARFDEAATGFVTDLSRRLVCERVSLGFCRGGHIDLKTISHSVRFGKRANLTRAIEAAMEEALDQASVIVFPSPSNVPHQIIHYHHELARRHGAGAICSVPLGHDGQIYGVLTFERLADNEFDAPTVELCEAIAGLAGPVLRLSFRDDLSLVTRAVEGLRSKITDVIGPERVVPKLAGLGLVAAIVFLALAKVEYRVAAKTLIEAQTQRAAVAPFNGFIAQSRVRAGDLVKPGQVLFTLDDRDLKLEAAKWRSQKEQYVKQYHVAMAEHNAAQVKIIMTQIGQADAELALVEDQLARAEVRAPIAGVITKGDLSQSIGAPAERGQVLFESAPLDAYRLILQIDERDIAEVAPGRRGNVVLSALPGKPLPFIVEKVTPVSEAREGRNYFRVEAKLEQTPGQLRPGMEGVGKIDLGRRLLVWSWTHRAIDWLRLLVWSWWP